MNHGSAAGLNISLSQEPFGRYQRESGLVWFTLSFVGPAHIRHT